MKYLYLSLEYTYSGNNGLMFFGPNFGGYTQNLDLAGIYDKKYEHNDNKVLSINIELIRKLSKKIKKEGETIFIVPNSGDIRKNLGISVLDFDRNGNNDQFYIKEFPSIYKEIILERLSKDKYWVEMKDDNTDMEYWFYNGIFQADSRNAVIVKAQEEWMLDDMSYLQFKSIIRARRIKEKFLKGWKRS
jgi:hypothetical protein